MAIRNIAYVRKHDLLGCAEGSTCDSCDELIPVLLIPLFDEEMEQPEVEGWLKFGSHGEVAPWTSRKIKERLQGIGNHIVAHPDSGEGSNGL